MIAIKNEAGGSYGDDAPTYVPPTTPRAIPRNRLKWLRPQDAVGRVLGVNAGPAANPTADWAQIEASFLRKYNGTLRRVKFPQPIIETTCPSLGEQRRAAMLHSQFNLN